MTEKWRVSVDPDRCIGSGVCAGTAPDHFRLDGQHSVPVQPVTDPADPVMDAAVSCPAEAILLADAATGAEIPLDD